MLEVAIAVQGALGQDKFLVDLFKVVKGLRSARLVLVSLEGTGK